VLRTEIVKLPAWVGVPLSTPVAPLIVSPLGNAPATTAYVYGAVPPVVANAWLYAVSAIAAGKVAGVSANVGAATVTLYGWVPVK